MQWSSTVKEVELSHFFKEWPAMWKRFWDIWIVSWVIIVGVAVMASPIVPYAFRMSVSDPCLENGADWIVPISLVFCQS
jgi:hypothetical protein